jgi:hypothetical protein
MIQKPQSHPPPNHPLERVCRKSVYGSIPHFAGLTTNGLRGIKNQLISRSPLALRLPVRPELVEG